MEAVSFLRDFIAESTHDLPSTSVSNLPKRYVHEEEFESH